MTSIFVKGSALLILVCRQLLQKQNEEERKARTKRLIERGAILESIISGGDEMSNEQIKSIWAVGVEG